MPGNRQALRLTACTIVHCYALTHTGTQNHIQIQDQVAPAPAPALAHVYVQAQADNALVLCKQQSPAKLCMFVVSVCCTKPSQTVNTARTVLKTSSRDSAKVTVADIALGARVGDRVG